MFRQTIKSTLILLIALEIILCAYFQISMRGDVQRNLLKQVPVFNLRMIYKKIAFDGWGSDKNRYEAQKSDYFVFDGTLGYRLKHNSKISSLTSNKEGKVMFDDQNILVTDRYGYVSNAKDLQRDYKAIAKDDKMYKIIISGGSTVAGWGASDNKNTWPAILERKLNDSKNEILNDYDHIAVINTGVLGYKISNEIRRFADETSYLNPNLVIAFNGINEKWTYKGNPVDYGFHSEQYRVMNGYNGVDRYKEVLFFPYFRLFAQKIAGMKLKFRRGDYYSYAQKGYLSLSYQELYLSKIKQFKKLSESVDAEFIYILQPLMGIGNKSYSKFEKLMIANYFGGKHFYTSSWGNYIKSARIFYSQIESGLDQPYMHSFADIFNEVSDTVYSDPRHYNDEGQEIIAEYVFKLVLDNYATISHK